jgi:hypothetical protein
MFKLPGAGSIHIVPGILSQAKRYSITNEHAENPFYVHIYQTATLDLTPQLNAYLVISHTRTGDILEKFCFAIPRETI